MMDPANKPILEEILGNKGTILKKIKLADETPREV